MKFIRHTIETAPEGSREILEGAQRQLGFVPNLYATMADAPPLLLAYTNMSNMLNQTSFSSDERNLLWLIISRHNGCSYCVAAHTAIASMAKVSDADLSAARNGALFNSPKLEALRTFAEAMIDARGWMSEDSVQAFIDAGFTRTQVLEVVAFIAHKTMSNFVNHFGETCLDDAFKPFSYQLEKNNKSIPATENRTN